MRVGAIELRLLEFLNSAGPTSVRDASNSFGKEQGVGLTTVQQMMERLRQKGLLERYREGGIWIYRTKESRETVLQGVVADFVDRTLGGSLEPLALYLTDRSKVSPEEFEKLRQIVNRIPGETEGDSGN
jgi:predicted transcriptional regulator